MSNDALKKIQRLAGSLQQRISEIKGFALPATFSNPHLLESFDKTLSLPPTRAITNDLLRVGLSKRLSEKVSDAFVRVVMAHARHSDQIFGKACHDLINSGQASIPMLESVRGTMQTLFANQVNVMASKAIASATRHIRQQTLSTSKSRLKNCRSQSAAQGFNHEFTPFLEKYFQHNAYPSTADRLLMAKKSRMHPDKIKNWFQNHRNRAKRDGKKLIHLKHDDNVDFSNLELSSLERDMSHYVIPVDERKDVDSDASEYEWQYDSDEEDVSEFKPKYTPTPNAVDVLNAPSALYAYPHGFVNHPYQHVPLPAPQWYRTASAPVARSPITADEFTEFISSFSRLDVHLGVYKHHRKKVPHNPRVPRKPKRTSTPPPKPDKSAATVSITTIPPAARHPSFVVVDPESTKKFTFRVPPPTPAPTVLAPTPISAYVQRQNIFKAPRPESPMATLVPKPPPIVTLSSGGRRLAGLPKRIPKGTSIAHGGVPSSPTSTYPYGHSRTPSRTPSLESNSFSSNSASSSRHVSDMLVTPEHNNTALPSFLALPGNGTAVALPGVNVQAAATQSLTDSLFDELDGLFDEEFAHPLDKEFPGEWHAGDYPQNNDDMFGLQPHADFANIYQPQQHEVYPFNRTEFDMQFTLPQ